MSDLFDALSFDPATGVFTWKTGNQRRKAGAVAGWVDAYGYRRIRIKGGKSDLAHRMAWFLYHGYWPSRMIDHINGDPSDNRKENLREASSAQNQGNRACRRDNKCGYRGVRYQKHTGKWAASIQIGSFHTPEEAHEAYLRMAEFAYGDFAPSLRPNHSLLRSQKEG